MERREARRFTEATRRRRRVWLLGLGAFAALAVLVGAIAVSPLMALREIRIEGASRADAVTIREQLQGELGTPLPLIDFGRVDEVISALPLVRSYSTESLPPGTLAIRVVERTPIGVVAEGDGFSLVDPARVVLSSSAERPPGYPLITVSSSRGFDAVSRALRELPAEMLAQVDSATATSTDDVTFTLAAGQRVIWGGPEDAALKATVLAKLIAATGGAAGSYDVSAPRTPVTR